MGKNRAGPGSLRSYYLSKDLKEVRERRRYNQGKRDVCKDYEAGACLVLGQGEMK